MLSDAYSLLVESAIPSHMLVGSHVRTPLVGSLRSATYPCDASTFTPPRVMTQYLTGLGVLAAWLHGVGARRDTTASVVEVGGGVAVVGIHGALFCVTSKCKRGVSK